MKFSIVIPTHNRPDLLRVVVEHAMKLKFREFEVIVSDNSSDDRLRALNFEAINEYIGMRNFKLVSPPVVLSPPEHFEFALDFIEGDYVVYLTDKMVILPHILSEAEKAIHETGAEIVNWAYAPYYLDDINRPNRAGKLVVEEEFFNTGPEVYVTDDILKVKASGVVARDKQGTKNYGLGKIVFGCYSRDLINRIRLKSGTLFNGATHDYSAMVQALAMANLGVMLNTYGIIFMSLPRDQSLGSLVSSDARWALRYYGSFSNGESIISNLLVPNLYSSVHNMVAHDYKKFLPIYGKGSLLNEINWLSAIYADISSSTQIWSSKAEKDKQCALFNLYVEDRAVSGRFKDDWRNRYLQRVLNRFVNEAKVVVRGLVSLLPSLIQRKLAEARGMGSEASRFQSIDEAISHLAELKECK